jgi:hypothetical protein
MVTKFIISYYKNGLWVNLSKGGGCPVGFDIRAKTLFDFPNESVVLLQTEVMPVNSSGYFFNTITEICNC